MGGHFDAFEGGASVIGRAASPASPDYVVGPGPEGHDKWGLIGRHAWGTVFDDVAEVKDMPFFYPFESGESAGRGHQIAGA
jgi:hypothetical protein